MRVPNGALFFGQLPVVYKRGNVLSLGLEHFAPASNSMEPRHGSSWRNINKGRCRCTYYNGIVAVQDEGSCMHSASYRLMQAGYHGSGAHMQATLHIATWGYENTSLATPVRKNSPSVVLRPGMNERTTVA